MKYIHVADLHIDRSFEGLGEIPPELSKILMKKNQEVLTNIVNKGIEEQVDFVLIVGDTFHQSQVTIQTQAFFMAEMKRLEKENIYVILSFGNHDYFHKEKYWFEFPQNVFCFMEEKIETIKLVTKKKETVAISGFSYENKWINCSKIREYPNRDGEADYHLGFYHGEQSQGEQEQHYAPFVLSEMKNKGYDYWALGHVHQPTVLSENPWILYPGGAIGHTKKEKDAHYYTIVEHNNKGTVVKWEKQSLVNWDQIKVDISPFKTLRELIEVTEESLLGLHELNTIQLVELFYEGSNELLEESIQSEMKNKGLIDYLQKILYEKTDATFWLFQIKRKLNETKKEQLPLGVTAELMEQLLNEYLAEEVFSDVVEPLRKKSELHLLVGSTQEKRKEYVAIAKEILTEALNRN